MIFATILTLRVFLYNSTRFPPDSSLLRKTTSIQPSSPLVLQPFASSTANFPAPVIDDEARKKRGMKSI